MLNPIPGAPAPTAGNHAAVTVGAPSRRTTVTRAVALGPLALAAKKNTTRIYLNVVAADGQEWVRDYPAKEEASVRRLAVRYNNACTPAALARAARQEARQIARRAARVEYQTARQAAKAEYKSARKTAPQTPRVEHKATLKTARGAAKEAYKAALRAA
jgi:hypothetical protein